MVTGCKKWKQAPWEDNTADGQRDSARRGRDEPCYSPGVAFGLFFLKEEKRHVCKCGRHAFSTTDSLTPCIVEIALLLILKYLRVQVVVKLFYTKTGLAHFRSQWVVCGPSIEFDIPALDPVFIVQMDLTSERPKHPHPHVCYYSEVCKLLSQTAMT